MPEDWLTDAAGRYPRPDVIDTHCHLTFPDFAADVPGALALAQAAGVTGCITIATTTHDSLTARDLAMKYPRVWHTAGVHPLYSDKGPHNWREALMAAQSGKCVAWGELGLDNHYTKPAGSVQRAVLYDQLAFIVDARRGRVGFNDQNRHEDADTCHTPIDLPVVIHCREAFNDLIPILKRAPIRPERFVFHCFTGTVADMRKVLDFGAYVSFTGVATYKNAPEVREAARLVPADRIMVETDAPFLPPEPKRTTRPCQPAFARITAESLAATRGVDFQTFHKQINENTIRFFGIPAE